MLPSLSTIFTCCAPSLPSVNSNLFALLTLCCGAAPSLALIKLISTFDIRLLLSAFTVCYVHLYRLISLDSPHYLYVDYNFVTLYVSVARLAGGYLYFFICP